MNLISANDNLSQEVVRRIQSVAGKKSLALHHPSFVGNEWLYLKECLDSTFVSSSGKFVTKFETEIAAYTGAKFAVSVSSGTAALHISLILSGVEPNDEVIIPALSFIATANAVRYCNAVPHFVDIEEEYLGLDAVKLSKYLSNIAEKQDGFCVNKHSGRVIRAIVPMHTFGHPSNMSKLLEVSKEFNLTLVEDAAESLGSFFMGKHTGNFGVVGAISFNGNKTITTGGGGVVVTNDEEIATRAKHLTTTAKLPHRWEYKHDEVGFNYRMPNLNAALGCAQLEFLPQKLDAKRKLYDMYESSFRDLKGVRLFKEPKNCKSNYWLQTLILDKPDENLLNQILDATNSIGISTRPAWNPINQFAPYSMFPKSDLAITESLSCRIINIPSSPNILGAIE